jgi:hypothetical protein
MSITKLLERTQVSREETGLESAKAEIKDYVVATWFRPPVTVERDRLEVDSTQLEVERVYPFDYLGAKMVLWKLPDNTIDIFQIIEE